MNHNIRLIRNANGGDVLMFEYLNSPSTGGLNVRPASSPVASGAKGSTDKTYAEQYEGTTDALREIVDGVRRYMGSLGNDVSENVLKQYLAIKKARNVVCVEVNKTRVIRPRGRNGAVSGPVKLKANSTGFSEASAWLFPGG